jgi:hypothetical protein
MFFWLSLPLSFFGLLAPSFWLLSTLWPEINLAEQGSLFSFSFLASIVTSRLLTRRLLAWALIRFKDQLLTGLPQRPGHVPTTDQLG